MTNYVCIPTTITDPNYRYKMPQMKLSQESRLNGVKTNISNLPDVARALRVPDSAILKYFCAEVGANSEGTTIVKGQHVLGDLEKHLNKFIMKYVCCSKCKLPEITHEVNKKNLVGVCRSCGTTNSKMDNVHKAGKQLIKDIPTYYAANPEFANTRQPGQAAMQDVPTTNQKGKKKGRRNNQAAAAAEQESQAQQAEEQRTKMAADQNREINILDSTAMPLNDAQIVQACEELKTFVDEKMADQGSCPTDDIMREVRQLQFQLNVTREYKIFIAMQSIFGQHRNIVKHWDAFEPVFKQLVAQDEDNGCKHLFQTTCQYFINFNPELQKFAATLCNKFYDNELLTDQFFVDWHAKKLRMDRDSILFDRKAENAMRPLLADFVKYLQEGEYGEEEDGYGAEEEETKEASGAAAQQEQESATETDAQRAQRELIERQKKAQAEQLEKAKAAGAESKAKAAAEAEEAKQAQAEAAATDLEQVQQKTNVADIAVDDGFDIDDI